MNTTLSNLNNKPVSAYITSSYDLSYSLLNDQNLLNVYGSLIIVDNTDEEKPIAYMSSDYGIYVDDVFIAGGYGFKSFKEYSYILENSNNLGSISEKLKDIEKNIADTDFRFNSNFSYENNIISPEYNTYGFITSYQYFDFYYDTNKNSYEFTLNQNTNVNKVTQIYIEENNPTDVEFKNEQSSPFNYTITIDYHGTGAWPSYNDGLKIYANSELLQLKNPSRTILSKSIQKEQNKFYKDLNIEIKNTTDKLVYSYFIPKFAKWKGKLIHIPTIGDVSKYANTIYLNFRNTGFTWTPPSTDTTTLNQISNLDELITKHTNATLFNFNEEFELTFDSGDTPLYDYILFDKSIYKDIVDNKENIEFYFNGIKSNNWYYEERNGKYIYQSPQPYIGRHTWKIKITKK